MRQITKSASKTVFLIIAIAMCIGLFTGNVSEENFILLAGSAFTYYFTKSKSNGVDDSVEETDDTKFTG